MRNILLSILGLLFIAGAIIGGNRIVERNNKPKPKYKRQIKTVFVENVVNKEIPVQLSAKGSLIAKTKIDIFSEVQGVLETSKKAFKAGTKFNKNETLLHINSDEFYASLQAQKNNLSNLITAILPDLQLDYSNEFKKWEHYLKGFDMNGPTPKLPAFSSDKEKYFVSGRGIVTAYYTVKNLEVRYAKHQIKAPFSGVLTEVFVTPGTLVRVGQRLGEFIDPSVYEMEVAISAVYADFLKVGKPVVLNNLNKTNTYTGKLIRVNGKVDQVSQTIKAFIEVKHPNLREGVFLEATMVAKSESNAIEIPRKLLVDNSSVYLIKKDSILTLTEVNPVYFGTEKVIIKGLANNTKLLSQTLPGAFDGMIVKINKKK
tara:strand:- start:3183 stop:4298 length:1116 start_codon:yes stop_codon:yes gene_type:complete